MGCYKDTFPDVYQERDFGLFLLYLYIPGAAIAISLAMPLLEVVRILCSFAARTFHSKKRETIHDITFPPRR